jgi:hypothetical protein
MPAIALKVAHARQTPPQPAAASGKRPNIPVIFDGLDLLLRGEEDRSRLQ